MEENDPITQSPTVFVTKFFQQLDHYKRLLSRYWWILVLTCGAAVAVQVYLLKHAAPSYVSSGRMIVNIKVSIPDGNVYVEDGNNFFGTQAALMKSESVVSRVTSRLRDELPQTPPSPVGINVSVESKSSIFDLQATGTDPVYTRAFLQGTMDEYVKLKRDMIANVSGATHTNMAEELAQIGVELAKSKQDVLQFRSSNDVVFLQPTGENSAANYLAELQHELDHQKSDLELSKGLTLDQNLERQQNAVGPSAPVTPPDAPNTAPPPNATTPSGGDSQGNATTASKIPANAPRQGDEAKTPSGLGKFEESYLQAKSDLVSLNAQRAGLIKLEKPTAKDIVDLDEKIAEQQVLLDFYKEQSKEQLENHQQVLQQQIQNLDALVSQWRLKALDASKKLADYQLLMDTETRLQTRYDTMQANLQKLQIDKGIGQESVIPLEAASVADSVPPGKAKHLAMAAIMGVFLGVGIMLFVDRLDDRPRSLNELEKLFDVPLLGQFPLIKAKNRKEGVPILQMDDDRHPLVESYRSLRSALLYHDPAKDHPKSIMITSARPNDGKSMVSCNFAITLAQAGARVLLIDADLRRGVLHKQFSLAGSPGLAEVLSGQCGWSAAVAKTPVPNLDLIPCGKSPRQPSSLFATAGTYLAEIPRHYDYYLFDTCPVMVGDDVLSLAPHVDGVIMVIRAGFTSGRIAQAAMASLSVRRVNVIGLAFNAVNTNTSDYYYYRFKEYYGQLPMK